MSPLHFPKRLFLMVSASALVFGLATAQNVSALEDRILGMATEPQKFNASAPSEVSNITATARGVSYSFEEAGDFGYAELQVLEQDPTAWKLDLLEATLDNLKFASAPELLFTLKDAEGDETLEGFAFSSGPLKDVVLLRKNEGTSKGYPQFATVAYFKAVANDPQERDLLYDELQEYKLAPFYFYGKNKADFCQKSFVTCAK
ncbi:hypothetical protein [Deinococcus misasensis]|uniref:hypothetical protein n=1 Tax=Deinococcus misasensis TaxID=392413 RepID=UPI00055816C4|nr:hypothetical protein [Deinococcus misasensis]